MNWRTQPAELVTITVKFGTWTFEGAGSRQEVLAAYERFMGEISAIVTNNKEQVEKALQTAILVNTGRVASEERH